MFYWCWSNCAILNIILIYRVCLVHAKIESLVENGTMWWKSWKFMCVGKFWCDGKVGSLKKKFVTKLGYTLIQVGRILCFLPMIQKGFNESFQYHLKKWILSMNPGRKFHHPHTPKCRAQSVSVTDWKKQWIQHAKRCCPTLSNNQQLNRREAELGVTKDWKSHQTTPTWLHRTFK